MQKKPSKFNKDTKEELDISHDYSNLQRETVNSVL